MTFNPTFEAAISVPRFAVYKNIAGSDQKAWDLYRWNLDLVSSLGPLSCDFEVTLRNTIHSQLSSHFGREDWWASHSLTLDDATHRAIAQIAKKHQKRIAAGTVGPGKVVADLMLGTWVMLLGRGGSSDIGRTVNYDTQLWQPVLRKGFATGTLTAKGRIRRPTRIMTHLRASNFRTLRNRAAHHEPIFDGILIDGTTTRVSLIEVRDQTIELLSWMSSDLAAVHTADPNFANVWTSRP
jgi:hypothetical protein